MVTLLSAQVTHSLGLNDVCDSLRRDAGPWSAIRGTTPPSRHNLSHANRERNGAFLSQWPHGFTRLFTLLRGGLWEKLELRSLLGFYGTAQGRYRFLGTPQPAYLPGLA